MINAPALDLPRLHRVEAITKHVGFSRETTYRLIASGKLKARRIGGRWFVTEDDAKAFLTGSSAR